MRVTASDFNLIATLESAQNFGFRKLSENCYEGRLQDVVCRVSQENSSLNVLSDSPVNDKAIRDFFDLDRNLSPLYQIMAQDPKLRPSYVAFKGLRILRQDPWEVIAGFIISANNNFKRIQGIWHRLSESFCGGNYRFPSAEGISKSSESELRQLGLGYRAPYLLNTARAFLEKNTSIEVLASGDIEESRRKLIQWDGIGPKVAECILLYGFHRLDAFPVDVWVQRVMRKQYYRGRKVSVVQINRYACKRWGVWAGYVQQYLFHSARISGLRPEGTGRKTAKVPASHRLGGTTSRRVE